MDGIRELNYLPQEIGPRAETFNDAWNLLPSRTRPPEIVGRGCFSSGIGVFNDPDFGGSGARRLEFFRILRPLRRLIVACHLIFLSVASGRKSSKAKPGSHARTIVEKQ